ncbi:MAG TPA: YitT family protein [Spirochaetota bacterium]|nr:YitT family protein [Spirochaetota bacterium]HPF08050.1 YitT family protein [Spirochaetota bacterium]HPJ43378.1 YitT family protein [Spirochaetota bacterium]HPR37530.1 YitT family protein [Spirochaetota bacterium]HRX49068.1 YitT family protein [Spirochaetota bacterium]
MSFEKFKYGILWNLLIITTGSIIFSLGVKGIVVHHGFIPAGLFGLGVLCYYTIPSVSAGIWYFLFNIPLFVMGWFLLSRRFVLYSFYAMTIAALSYELITVDFAVKNQLYAAILAGVICGFGSGMVLRSLGSNGGLDVVAIILNQRYNIGIGKVYFIFNLVLFSMSAFVLEIDLIIASLILVFILSYVLEYTLALFSQRKIVMIISDNNKKIAEDMLEKLKLGATFINGNSAYPEKERNIIMAITNNIMLKPLEEIVFSNDENAVFIIENTFNVIGTGFSKRKIY